jgi:hypothetical protein
MTITKLQIFYIVRIVHRAVLYLFVRNQLSRSVLRVGTFVRIILMCSGWQQHFAEKGRIAD